MKKMILICALWLSVFSIFSVAMPVSYVDAAESNFTGPVLVKCSGEEQAGVKECTWKDLIKQVNRIIDFLFYLSVIIATIAFIYCGVLFLTAGGDSSKAGAAKKLFFNVVIGFIWIFAAWLIVHFITTALGLNSDISILGN